MNGDALIVYVTYASETEAQSISRALVEGRLVACANMFPAHQSMYWWEGAVQEGTEVAVMYKTRADMFVAVKDKILTLHSYECPCIVAWDIARGHDGFMEWIAEQTAR